MNNNQWDNFVQEKPVPHGRQLKLPNGSSAFSFRKIIHYVNSKNQQPLKGMEKQEDAVFACHCGPVILPVAAYLCSLVASTACPKHGYLVLDPFSLTYFFFILDKLNQAVCFGAYIFMKFVYNF